MRASLPVFIAFFTAVWASPQPHGRLHGQTSAYGRYDNGTYQSGHPSGRPLSAAAGTAPHGLSHTIVILESTVLVTVVITPTPAPNEKVANIESSTSAEIEAIKSEPKFSGKSETCNLEPVTVTHTPTVTVTVTQSINDDGVSTVSSPPIQSSDVPSIEGEDRPIKADLLPKVFSRSSTTPEPKEATAKLPEASLPTVATPPVAKASENADSEPSKAVKPIPVPEVSEAPVSVQAPAPTVVNVPSTPQVKPGNKRGFLASGPDTPQLVSAFNNSPKVTWLVDWYSGVPPNLDPHIEFVPQNYGKQSDIAPDFTWTLNAKLAVQKGRKHFLSFGEPETPNDLLHMEPPEAVDLFMKKMQPYANDVTLGAPSVTQPDRDLAWLSQFLDLCDAAGCSIGFVCIHWFSSASQDNIQGFKDVVNKAITIAKGKPVWVDNFSATGTNAEQQDFLSGVLPWLESNSNVERYAYVSPARKTGTGFLNADGSISSLGEFYANF